MIKFKLEDLLDPRKSVSDVLKTVTRCVYLFTYESGKHYVGSTDNMYNRLYNTLFGHIVRYNDKHKESPLYLDMTPNTELTILAQDLDDYNSTEEDYIFEYDSIINGYNKMAANCIKEGNSWINKNNIAVMCPDRLIEKYLSTGWTYGGNIGGTTTDYYWIHNPTSGESKLQHKSLELPEGWEWGRGIGYNAGNTAVNKDGVVKFIDPSEVDQYLADGWTPGNGTHTNKGTTWMNNGTKSIRVADDEVDQYLADGYVIGNLCTTNAGRKWFCNGFDNLLVFEDQVPEGYYPGKLGALGLYAEGMTYVTDGSEIKFIKESDVPQYPGWVCAYIGYVKVSNDSECYDIYPNELMKYLDDKWVIVSKHNHVVITDGTKVQYIHNSFLDKFLAAGWKIDQEFNQIK